MPNSGGDCRRRWARGVLQAPACSELPLRPTTGVAAIGAISESAEDGAKRRRLERPTVNDELADVGAEDSDAFGMAPNLSMVALDWLTPIGDDTAVPTSMRKKASCCGGIAPTCGVLPPFKNNIHVAANPSNAVYAKVVRRLSKTHGTTTATALQRPRVQHIQCFNDEHLGDLVEAALAAADMARAFENKTIR